MSTSDALGSLGSDLLFSVSFSIARELLDGAKEANLTEDELISIVLAVSVVLAAVPSSPDEKSAHAALAAFFIRGVKGKRQQSSSLCSLRSSVASRCPSACSCWQLT